MKIEDDIHIREMLKEHDTKNEHRWIRSVKVALGFCTAAMTVFSAIVLVLIKYSFSGHIPTWGDISIMILYVWLITFCIYGLNEMTKK